jgi:hypothetical protein
MLEALLPSGLNNGLTVESDDGKEFIRRSAERYAAAVEGEYD